MRPNRTVQIIIGYQIEYTDEPNNEVLTLTNPGRENLKRKIKEGIHRKGYQNIIFIKLGT